MATILDRVFGGSFATTMISDIHARADVRIYLLAAASSGHSLILPPTRIGNALVYPARKGVVHTVFVTTNTVTIKDSAGTTLGTIAAGNHADIFLMSDVTAAGTWLLRQRSTFAVGASIASNRRAYRIDLSQSAAPERGFECASFLRQTRGWDGTTPVAITLTIDSAYSRTRGSGSTAWPAIDTGTLPSGSTLLLIQAGYIVGAGGDGGAGGGALTPQNGRPGGPALTLRCAHAIANYGTIGGGGGGGGGGAATATLSGPGGGGGAGYLNGRGGPSPAGTLPQGPRGLDGNTTGGGPAGGPAGGSGGNLGSAGNNGSATGGAAGDAIQCFNGFYPPVFTVGGVGGVDVLGAVVSY